MRAAKTSAGCLLYRIRDGQLEILAGHMGGPFWSRKDEGAWTIPKGEYDETTEDPFEVALREFEEELGTPAPASTFLDLGSSRQASGKVVRVWAAEGDLDASRTTSNTFRMEWPKGSGTLREFPEIDKAAWLGIEEARRKLIKAHAAFLDRLAGALRAQGRLDDE